MNLRLGDQPFAQQDLDVTVVARALKYLRLPYLIHAAVADVSPVGAGFLHQAYRASRTRPCFHREAHAELDHFFVSSAKRQMQKTQRIEDRMWRLPECLNERGERGLGGTSAFGMTTHAVDDGEQHGLLGSSHRNPVLILFAMADQAHIRGLDLQ